MGLTVTEKEHWRSRIARKIERAIDELIQKNEPQFKDDIAKKARTLALDAFGGSKLLDRRTKLKADYDKLKSEIKFVERELLAGARGVPVESIDDEHAFDYRFEPCLKERQQIIEQELMAKHPLGQRILRLQNEEEELLDTVWLATSAVQIRTLWEDVCDLLSFELTPLQKKTVATKPPTDGE
jgi:hypothetical protein